MKFRHPNQRESFFFHTFASDHLPVHFHLLDHQNFEFGEIVFNAARTAAKFEPNKRAETKHNKLIKEAMTLVTNNSQFFFEQWDAEHNIPVNRR